MVGLMGWGVSEQGWRKGPWTPEEDKLLTEYVRLHGEGRWSCVARSAELNRSGKSCRLRWVNYLRPGLKKGQITPQEEGIIIELHALWGNKWSTIARYLPGRTDNEIKNYWRTHFKKKAKPSQKQEKRKTQLQLDQQKQEKQENDMNMNKLVSPHIAEVSNEKITERQDEQEMVSMYPTNTMEDQWLPKMYQNVASWSDTITEDGLWGGLWNLQDDPYRMSQTSDCNKIHPQSGASTAYLCGADTLNLYNGGYIF
ncbi:hypothetical protein F0562_005178 [Nyssa sinensis]|uniref:Uncharacterized protein n=1 Tax=Nyssa sinensis TaxID=561372 RepID=A0A5J5AJY5_9ASTE|nr:hypothetical protein F0562_005178 [Nyssa sinensis]